MSKFYKNKFFIIAVMLFIISIISISMTFKMSIGPIFNHFEPWYITVYNGKPNPWHFYKLTSLLSLTLAIVCFVKARKNVGLKTVQLP